MLSERNKILCIPKEYMKAMWLLVLLGTRVKGLRILTHISCLRCRLLSVDERKVTCSYLRTARLCSVSATLGWNSPREFSYIVSAFSYNGSASDCLHCNHIKHTTRKLIVFHSQNISIVDRVVRPWLGWDKCITLRWTAPNIQSISAALQIL